MARIKLIPIPGEANQEEASTSVEKQDGTGGKPETPTAVEKTVETAQGVENSEAFKKLQLSVKNGFENVNETIKAVNEVLATAKTLSERTEALEKQLSESQAINKQQEFPIFHEEVPESVIFKGLTETTPREVVLDTLNKVYEAPTESEVIKNWQRETSRIKILSGCLDVRPQELDAWPAYEKFLEDTGMAKIVNLTGAPSNYIPVGWSDEIQRYFYQELEVAQMFSRFPMPQNPFDWKLLGDPEAVRYTERTNTTATRGTNDPAKQDPLQGNVRFDAKVMMVPMLITEEFTEDMLDDYMDTLIEESIPMALARGLEKAIINGDLQSTHQDHGEPTNSVARNMDGLRRIALERSATINAATYNFGVYSAMLRKGGIYTVRPRDGAWIFSNSAYTQALHFPQLETLDKTNMPTNTEGAVAMLLGRPVYVSGQFPENLDTTGVISSTPGSNTKTGLLHVNRRQFRLGTIREAEVEMEKDIQLQSWVIVATSRQDFQAMENRRNGYTPSVYGINITSQP